METEEIQREYDALVEIQCLVVKTGMELQVLLMDVSRGAADVHAVMAAQCSYVENIKRLYERTIALKQYGYGWRGEVDEALDDYERFCIGFVEDLAHSHEAQPGKLEPKLTRPTTTGSWTLYTKTLPITH